MVLDIKLPVGVVVLVTISPAVVNYFINIVDGKLPTRLAGVTTWYRLARDYLDVTGVPQR